MLTRKIDVNSLSMGLLTVLVIEVFFLIRMVVRRRKLRFNVIQIDAHGGEVGQWVARKYFETGGTLKFLRVDDKEYVTIVFFAARSRPVYSRKRSKGIPSLRHYRRYRNNVKSS